jgi:recombination protein RecA
MGLRALFSGCTMAKKKAGKKTKVTKIAEEFPADGKEKKPSLNDILGSINKKYGTDSIGEYGAAKMAHYTVVTSGSLKLDHALGCEGIPRGRIIEIYGPEASGKTWLSNMILAQFQQTVKDRKVAIIDAEHAIDPLWTPKVTGLNLNKTIFTQPMTAEEALNTCLMLAESGEVSCIVIDSIAAMTPKAELEGDIGASHPGLQARLVNQFLRKIGPVLQKTNTTLICINQIRMKIGVMFGSPETTPGGGGMKFYASMRFRTSRKESIGPKEKPIGWVSLVRVKKNKCGVPFAEPCLAALNDRGIWREKEIIELGSELGVVVKKGAHYSLPADFPEEFAGMKLGQGCDTAALIIEASPKLVALLTKRILAA